MKNIKERWAEFVESRHVDWTWAMLCALYAEPHREYHNISHVAACSDLLRTSPSFADTPIVELALFFHDVVYVPGDKRNEELSANLLRSLLPVARLSSSSWERACLAIMATQHHETVVDDTVSQLTVDIDLSILGADLPVYDRYAAAIRKEYSSVSDDAWRVGRSRFLTEMVERPQIFQTAWGRQQFEDRARNNMRQELYVLEGR